MANPMQAAAAEMDRWFAAHPNAQAARTALATQLHEATPARVHARLVELLALLRAARRDQLASLLTSSRVRSGETR